MKVHAGTVPDDAVLDQAARLLSRRVGLCSDATRRGRLSRSVAEEAGRLHLDATEYVAALEQDPVLLQGLLDRITVQETSFFRDPKQFDVLARHVLPDLPRPLKIWSAGCANGQEPYSLAMLLTELGDLRSTVIATDISSRALERSRRARYSPREVADLGPRRSRFLADRGTEFEVVPEVRSRVELSAHNLAADPPPFQPGTCPIVFCRNVLIYFGAEDLVAFVNRLADWMPHNGWLFLGYSESLWQITDRFQLVRLDDAFVYQRRDAMPRARQIREPERPTAKPRTPVKSRVEAPAPRVPVANGPAASATPEQTGDPGAAIVAFRRHAYLEPENQIAHLHLALALEASGDTRSARRAYGAAREALNSCDAAIVATSLEGYGFDELARLLERKLVDQ